MGTYLSEFISQMESILANMSDFTKYTIIFALAVTLITIILRILLSVNYQGFFIAVKASKKDKKSKLIQKVLEDYKAAADRGVVSINTEKIVDKHMMKLNFLGWSFESIEGFIKKIEAQSAFVILGSILLPDTDKLWCGVTLAVMLFLFWFLGSIFDFEETKKKLKVEIIDYVENKEGVYYSKDLNSIILSLKNELKAAVTDNNTVLTDSINKLNTNLKESFEEGKKAMVDATESSMKALTDYSAVLKEPMEEWRKVLAYAGKIQNEMNISVDKMSKAMIKFEDIYQKLDKSLDTKSENTKELIIQLRNQVEQLFSSVAAIQEAAKNTVLQNELLEKQLAFVKENQNALEISLQKYEVSLQDISSNMGKTIGNIADIYSKNSAKELSDRIDEITEKVNNTNRRIIENINENIENINRQNIIQQQSIIDIKEELEGIRESAGAE